MFDVNDSNGHVLASNVQFMYYLHQMTLNTDVRTKIHNCKYNYTGKK